MISTVYGNRTVDIQEGGAGAWWNVWWGTVGGAVRGKDDVGRNGNTYTEFRDGKDTLSI